MTLTAIDDVELGESRCSPEDRGVVRSGCMTRHCFAFPRRALWIQHEHHPAFVADATRITLYNPNLAFERRLLDPAGGHADWISVSDKIAREVIARFDPGAAEAESSALFKHPFAMVSSHLYLTHHRLHEYVRQTSIPDLLFVEETAVCLLWQTIESLYRSSERLRLGAFEARRRPQRDIVEDVCAHLNATFHENETLTSIATRVGSSVFHLCRVFRKRTGLTMHAYRNHLRLRAAIRSIERRKVDLLTVALEVGYSSHSHFTTSFRREFGIVPSTLRKCVVVT